MHKFDTPSQGYVWINLDQVTTVTRSHAGDGAYAVLQVFGSHWTIAMTVDDVLALISPAAAPDTYEGELAQAKAARIDELYRTAKIFMGHSIEHWPQWVLDVVATRELAIREGSSPDVSILPAEEAKSIAIAARKTEINLLFSWMQNACQPKVHDLVAYLRDRLHKLDLGEV
jgi:F420-0:gamma-glutamyl ligase